jgi:hypothetical protein
MVQEIAELSRRIENLEIQNNQEMLTLIELLSNVMFFGELKKANCKCAKDGQCSYFMLKCDAKNKLPIVTDCHIKDCEQTPHCHIELSNLTCALCQTIPPDIKQALVNP